MSSRRFAASVFLHEEYRFQLHECLRKFEQGFIQTGYFATGHLPGTAVFEEVSDFLMTKKKYDDFIYGRVLDLSTVTSVFSGLDGWFTCQLMGASGTKDEWGILIGWLLLLCKAFGSEFVGVICIDLRDLDSFDIWGRSCSGAGNAIDGHFNLRAAQRMWDAKFDALMRKSLAASDGMFANPRYVPDLCPSHFDIGGCVSSGVYPGKLIFGG